MRVLALGLALWVLAAPVAPAALASGDLARSKPGPITVRGTVTHVRSGGFDLHTSAHGTFTVLVVSATQIVESGRSGRIHLAGGDHVGVRGLLSGRQLRAVTIRIYPVKPKPISLKGTIIAKSGDIITLQVGNQRRQVTVRPGTSVVPPGHLAVGDRVDIRALPDGHAFVAQHIHLYARHVPLHRVTIHGTIVRVSRSSLTVSTGSTTAVVQLHTGTSVTSNQGTVSAATLQPGRRVTIHACCQGRALVASSIRVLKAQVQPVHTFTVHGMVLSVSSGELTIRTTGGTMKVTTTARTRVDPVQPRAGDSISLRVYRDAHGLHAVRVHVSVSSRAPRSVTGSVVSVGRSSIVVTRRGKRYTVLLPPGTTVSLDGRPGPVSSLRVGDQVHTTGHLIGSTMTATVLTATRSRPKVVTIRGTLTKVLGGFEVRDTAGSLYMVRLSTGAVVHLNRVSVVPSALFPGVHVTAKGVLKGHDLVASLLAATARARSFSGQLVAVNVGALIVSTSGGRVIVHLLAGVPAQDEGARVSLGSLRAGAYVRVRGYEDGQSSVRGSSIEVLHPTLTLRGTLLSSRPLLSIEMSDGRRASARVSSVTQVLTGRAQISLTMADVPDGLEVTLHGVVDRTGVLVCDTVTIHLQSQTVRGRVTAASPSVLTLDTGTGSLRVRLTSVVSIAQGTHPIPLSGLVTGDDVTAYGYTFGHNTVLARKLTVHRARATVVGTVATTSPNGFTLSTATGAVQVMTDGSTQIDSGVNMSVGESVKVSGYRRGDGTLLAFHVAAGRKRVYRTVSLGTLRGFSIQSPRMESDCGSGASGAPPTKSRTRFHRA